MCIRWGRVAWKGLDIRISKGVHGRLGANMEDLYTHLPRVSLRKVQIYESYPSIPILVSPCILLPPPIPYLHLYPIKCTLYYQDQGKAGLKGGKARSQQLYLDLDIKELKNRVSSHYSILRTCLLNRIILL